MSVTLDAPLLLYTLQTLKERDDDCLSLEDINKTTPSDVLKALPTVPVSIPVFVNGILHPPPHASTLYVTNIEWRAAPQNELDHEYAIIHAAITPQCPPDIAIRIDRYGGLGVHTRWWRCRPAFLSDQMKRTLTTVVAGLVNDKLADPRNGRTIAKYTHWTQEIPPGIQIPELRRKLERARNHACAALNRAIRPHVIHNLHTPEKQVRYGRRWADSRGLQLVHVDVASTVADAMETGIIGCGMQAFCYKILPTRIVWRSVRRRVRVREEYSLVVRDYRRELRDIAHSLTELDQDTRSTILSSWGVEDNENQPRLPIQLLNQSLSRHAFISPFAPMATLVDVASRLDTIVPLLPASGPTINMCALYARTLLARFPDGLWYSYTTPAPPAPVSVTRATWHRAKDSRTFWLVLEIGIQWIIAFALIPVHWMSDIWVLALPIIHMMVVWPWILKERKAWRRVWKVYEGAIIQDGVVEWENDTHSLSSPSKVSLLRH